MQRMTSFLPTNPKEVRTATTLLYLNVRYCTDTNRTNPATVSSLAYLVWVQMYDYNAWTLYISKIYNYKSNTTSK